MDKSLIGIPWKLGGRDRNGIDCLGLVILAERELFGVTIPDAWVYTEQDYGAVSLMAAAHMPELGYIPVDVPTDGDIAYIEIAGHGHLGVWIGGAILTIVEGGRSSWKRRRLPFRYFRPWEVGEWA
jgi:cell wall-associated NlpC family hydrolase